MLHALTAHGLTLRKKTKKLHPATANGFSATHSGTQQHDPFLRVSDLCVSYGEHKAIRGLDLFLERGGATAIVGESGSGKSTFLKAIAGLLSPTMAHVTGSILFEGREITNLSGDERSRLRSERISYLFQNGQQSLDPLFTIDYQFDELLRAHGKNPQEVEKTKLLSLMDIDDPARVLASLPSELSGGLCQRVCVAFALAGAPHLLLADEPTSSLDPQSQDKVADLLLRANKEEGVGLLVVTHDISLASRLADTIVVMRNGEVVESGTTCNILNNPTKPYTQQLIDSIPRNDYVLSPLVR